MTYILFYQNVVIIRSYAVFLENVVTAKLNGSSDNFSGNITKDLLL